MRTFLIAAALTLLPVAGHASSSSDINTCKAAVAEAVADSTTSPMITYESIRGASKKTVTFTVTDGDTETTAVCTIKRGKVLSVDV